MTVVEDRPLVVRTRRRSPLAAWWAQTATMDGRARVQRDVIVPFLASVALWPVVAVLALVGRLEPGAVLAWTGVMCIMSAIALAVVIHVGNIGDRIMNGDDDPEAHEARVGAALRVGERERIK